MSLRFPMLHGQAIPCISAYLLDENPGVEECQTTLTRPPLWFVLARLVERFDFFAGQFGQEPQALAGIIVRHVDPVLVEQIGARPSIGQPDFRAAFRLATHAGTIA